MKIMNFANLYRNNELRKLQGKMNRLRNVDSYKLFMKILRFRDN